MKHTLTFILTVVCLLAGNTHNSSAAAKVPSKPDTSSTWVVQITPAPGLNSYATREIHLPIVNGPALTGSSEKTVDSAVDSIVIVPRYIPAVPSQPECSNCNSPRRPLMNRMAARSQYSAYTNSWPWSQNSYFANLQSVPGLYMYSDLIRSNWFGSPYPGHTFYYNGYRPSFRFGSLQFRGFGNYDRMYNPRIIPFGYQYSGSRNLFAALALEAQYGY
ncbi:MAG: hypothetical protein ABIK07_08915 [Planctomycetota bacterium]